MSKKLRSHKWFYGINETGLLHKGALRAAGIDMDNYHGEPVIGIANTWGEVNNCNMSLKTIAEEVKKRRESRRSHPAGISGDYIG